MKKKQVVSMVTAMVMTSSTMVAVAPIKSEAATDSVDKAIKNATEQMVTSYNLYHKIAKNEGKLPSTGAIRKQVSLAQDYYDRAKESIKRSSVSKKKKADYTKRLDSKKKYLIRSQNYLTAVNTNLKASKQALDMAVKKGKQSKVLTTQLELSNKISKFEESVSKVYGPDTRKLLTKIYANPAKEKVISVQVEMNVYQAYKQIERDDLLKTNRVKAEKLVESVKKEVEILKTKDTALAKNILKAVNGIIKDHLPSTGLTQTQKEVEEVIANAKNDEKIEITLHATENLSIETTKNLTVILSGDLHGKDIVINAPDAHITNSAVNAGKITVEDVSGTSYEQKGTFNSLIYNDLNGGRLINGTSSPLNISLGKEANVTLQGEFGIVTTSGAAKVVVSKDTNIKELVANGAVSLEVREGGKVEKTTGDVIATLPTPQISVPQVPAPEVSTPEVPAPGIPEPEISTPEVPAPGIPEPEISMPEVPTIPEPEVPTPEVPVPEMPEPEVPTPEVPTPEIPEPEVPTPEIPEPEVPEPEVPAPEIPTPEVPTPEIPEPEVPTPPITEGGNDDETVDTSNSSTGNIEGLKDNTISIEGKDYTFTPTLSSLLNEKNGEALKGANIGFKYKGNTISSITNLELKSLNGKADENLIFDGGHAVIEGSVSIEGDYYEVKNLTVTEDFTISNQVENSFVSEKLTVQGTTKVADKIQNNARFAAFKLAAESNPKTRVTIVFKDATIAVFEISKEDVYFSATGSTKVTSLSIQANAEIFADGDVIIPQVKIVKGVTQVVLNATIQDVFIDSNDEIEVSGSGNFTNVVVNTVKKVTLNTIGKIEKLEMKENTSPINIGNTVKITDIIVPEGKTANDHIENYDEAIEHIEKIGGEDNSSYVPVEDEKDDYFAVGVLHAEKRFGYVTLNIKNQGNHKVKYQLVEKYKEPSMELLEKGDQVPAQAVEYNKGDEFLLWANHDIFVYQADENGTIIEAVELTDYMDLYDIVVENDKLSFKTTYKHDKSVKEFMKFIYVYHGNKVEKFTNFSEYKWEIQDGISILNLKLNNAIDLEKPGRVMIGSNALELSHNLGEVQPDEMFNLFVLHEVASDDTINKEFYFEAILNTIAYEDDEQELYNQKLLAERDSLSMASYAKELKANSFPTNEAVKEMVKKVNKLLKDKVDAYKNARKLVEQLFKENRYSYPEKERLREAVTQTQIDNAKAELTLISNEFVEKEYLSYEINNANYLLNQK